MTAVKDREAKDVEPDGKGAQEPETRDAEAPATKGAQEPETRDAEAPATKGAQESKGVTVQGEVSSDRPRGHINGKTRAGSARQGEYSDGLAGRGGTGSSPPERLRGGNAQDSSSDVVIRLTGLSKTFLTGFLPVRALAKRGSAGVRPELDKRFLPQQVEAVRNLDLEVKRGEIFGLLGPNGSGKTTTIKMMMGLIFPTTGTLELLGHPVGHREAKRRLGYLPENPAFYDYLRADELLELAARLSGVPKATRRRRIPELLAQVGLSEALNRSLRKFSKGMLQRIGLAQALVHDPELVVLDEPMSGLDPIGRKEVRDLIFALREEGKTVIFSTHILSDVEMICDRVAILVQGELRDIGPLHGLLSAKRLETEVVLQGSATEAAHLAASEGWPALREGDRLQIRLPGESDPGPLLTTAIGEGARVIAVVPRTESLEDLFVRQAKAAPAGVANPPKTRGSKAEPEES